MRLSMRVENALYACGRERIFSRDGYGEQKPAIAIRFDGVKVDPPDTTKPVIMCEGSTHDDAGEAAARAFVSRLRDAAKNLTGWADRIEKALAAETSATRAAATNVRASLVGVFRGRAVNPARSAGDGADMIIDHDHGDEDDLRPGGGMRSRLEQGEWVLRMSPLTTEQAQRVTALKNLERAADRSLLLPPERRCFCHICTSPGAW